MKIAFRFFVAVTVVFLLINPAIASLKEFRAFGILNNEKTLNEFQSFVIKEGHANSEGVSVDFLAEVSRNFILKPEKHGETDLAEALKKAVSPEILNDPVAYATFFRDFNGLKDRVPFVELKRLVASKVPDVGIFFPIHQLPDSGKVKVAQAPEVIKTDAPAVAVVQPAVKPDTLKPSEAEVQIGNLQKQITEVRKALAGNAEANKRLSALEKHLNELAKNVESVGKGQKDLAQNQAMISDSLAEIGNALLALKADFSNEIGRVETKMDYGFYEIYESVTYNQRVIFISLFGMIAILSLFFWFANRKTRRIANEAKDLADKANFKATNADNLAKQAGATVGSLEVEIDEILGTTNDETKGLCIHDQEKITPEKTAFLTIGSNTTVMVEFSGNAVEVIFERFTDDSFVVHGVKRNNDTEDQTCIIKRNTNFVRFLKKAYKDKRIIGTTSIKVNKAA